MAKPTCIKCGGQIFEAVEFRPQKSKYDQLFIQCAKCGGVVGVKDQQNSSILIQKLAEKLNVKL
jgi:NAD-dependent SIR2 family protein deacetylase